MKMIADHIQWNEVKTSTAHNFNMNLLLYLIFSSIINLCPNIWFIRVSKYRPFFFRKKSRQKNLIKILIFLKGRSPTDMNVGVFWETSVDFLKSVQIELFPIYSKSSVNLNAKVGQN